MQQKPKTLFKFCWNLKQSLIGCIHYTNHWVSFQSIFWNTIALFHRHFHCWANDPLESALEYAAPGISRKRKASRKEIYTTITQEGLMLIYNRASLLFSHPAIQYEPEARPLQALPIQSPSPVVSSWGQLHHLLGLFPQTEHVWLPLTELPLR